MGRVTTDTVPTLLERPDIAQLFYVRISGIPYLFSNLPIPSQWDEGSGTMTYDGETHAWSQTLVVDGDFGALSQKVEPKRGLGVAGSMKLRFVITGTDDPGNDVWLSLLHRDLNRSDGLATQIASEITADESVSFDVDDATDWSASDQDVYISLETLRANRSDPDTMAVSSRGAYGSWAMHHRIAGDIDETTGRGPFMTDWPLVWEGRIAEVVMALGRVRDGTWEPYEDANGGRVEQMVYRGMVNGVSEGGSTLSVSLSTRSLDQLLGREVCRRQPRGRGGLKAGAIDNNGRLSYEISPVYVGPHNWWLSWSWYNRGNGGAGPQDGSFIDMRLVDSGGVNVSEGLYSPEEVLEYMIATIDNEGLPNGDMFDSTGGHIIVDKDDEDDDPKYKLALYMNFARNDIDHYKLILHERPGSFSSVFVDLGFDGDNITPTRDGDDDSGVLVQVYTASHERPRFRWPARDEPMPNRLYYFQIGGNDFQSTTGWQDDNGNNIPGAVVIGDKEIVEFFGTSSTTYTKTQTDHAYLNISERRVYNTGSDEPIVTPWTEGIDKSVEIKQGIYLPGTSVGRALLYLIHSGSGAAGTLDATYDQGWSSSGLALPGYLTNTDEILAASDLARARRDQIWIGEPTQLREFIAPELQIEQLLLVADADWSTGADYSLTLVSTPPPSEADGSSTIRVLDHSNTLTFGAGDVGLDRQENKIINAAKIQASYDHAAGKYHLEIPQRQVTSQQVWGARPPITLQAKSIADVAETAEIAARMAQRVFARYALPYTIIELDTASAATWAWRVGDVVSITNDVLPNVNGAPGRGWSEVKARLMVKKDFLQGQGGRASRLTMIVNDALGFRYSQWAPCCVLSSLDSGNTWNVVDHYFTEDIDSKDLEWFVAGYEVTVQQLGNTSTTALTVTDVDVEGSQITFDGAVPGGYGSGGDIVVYFADYGTAVDAQKKYVYQSDGDGLVDTDPAFRYV